MNHDKRIKQQAVEVSYVGGSMYATLLSEILMNRTKEIEDCKIHYSIPTSETERKTRYFVGDLVRTNYGQQVIEALGISISLPVGTVTFALKKLVHQRLLHKVPNFMDMRKSLYHANMERIREVEAEIERLRIMTGLHMRVTKN